MLAGGTCRVKGVAAASLHVSTCVRPRRDDMLIGIRNAPSKANNAALDRSIDGMATSSLGRIGYERARQLLLTAGIVILLLVAFVMYVRRVETVEVYGTLLFIPVFIAFVLAGVRGGLIAAVVAAAAYAAFRYPAIEAVGADRFVPLIFSRAVAYLAFGGIGGWATQQLEASLNKLELYDQIDDQTGLFNAGFFVQDTDLELSRSQRYQTVFSVATVDVPAKAFESRSRRDNTRIWRDLGRMLGQSVRTVDRAVHGFDGNRHRIAVVLPETGAEGARIFVDRLAAKIAEHLHGRNVQVAVQDMAARALTYPGHEADLQALKAEFAAIDQAEHPEGAQQRGGSRAR